MRAAAEFLGQIASLEIAAAESREYLQYRLKLDAAHQAILLDMATDGQLASLAQKTPGLLSGVEASGVAVLEGGQWATAGETPTELQLDALLPWLNEQVRAAKDARLVVAVDQLAAHLPAATEFSAVASGLLAIPLSNDADGNWLVWFRPEQVQTFNWGGNPYEKTVATGTHGARLSPRKSFEIWQEEVRGRSAPWKTVEVEAAVTLRLLLLDVVIGRARQLEALNSDLVRSNDELDAFAYVAGHDLKEPLRGIHKYAHQLMEEARDGQPMDERGRARIDSLLRLTVRMDSLLDALLHFSRVGRLSLEQEDAPLDEVVTDAIDMLGGRLEDSGIALRRPRPMPVVRCDPIRVREIFANLIANAVKYNDKPDRWIEIGYIDPETEPLPPRQPAAPANAPRTRVFYVRDNGIGIEERHRDRVFMMFKRLHAREAFGGGSGAGLAIVKKLVDQHRGQIWYESTLGVGTTFYFTLPSSGPEKVAEHA